MQHILHMAVMRGRHFLYTLPNHSVKLTMKRGIGSQSSGMWLYDSHSGLVSDGSSCNELEGGKALMKADSHPHSGVGHLGTRL